LNKIKRKKILCKVAHIRNIILKYFFLFSKIKFIYTKDKKKKIIVELEKPLQKLNA
jgi:hypothetical protein